MGAVLLAHAALERRALITAVINFLLPAIDSPSLAFPDDQRNEACGIASDDQEKIVRFLFFSSEKQKTEPADILCEHLIQIAHIRVVWPLKYLSRYRA